MILRKERDEDVDAVRRLLISAFPTEAEAELVDRLRSNGRAKPALVAELDGEIVGHVCFSPVRVDGGAGGVGLAPLAVREPNRRSGIGFRLVIAGLEACRVLGARFVVVLGDPRYYARFGFRRALDVGLGNEYGAVDEFVVLELEPGSLPKLRGLVRYGPEFAVFA